MKKYIGIVSVFVFMLFVTALILKDCDEENLSTLEKIDDCEKNMSSGSINRNQFVCYSTANSEQIDQPFNSNVIDESVIEHLGYIVSYNHATLNPNWVAYELTADESDGPVNRKGRRFIPDPKVKGPQAENDDYRNSGWSRGHMAPAADMKWDSVAMDECFYFTNCCPQDATFNDGKWHSLEKKTRAIARQYGRVYVVTGPIVGKNVNGTIGKNRVVVPDAFFKAWLVPVDGTYTAIGFVLYNSPEDQDISASACTIDELELLTGFDFYHNLDDKTEKRVEANIDWKYWKGVGIVP